MISLDSKPLTCPAASPTEEKDVVSSSPTLKPGPGLHKGQGLLEEARCFSAFQIEVVEIVQDLHAFEVRWDKE